MEALIGIGERCGSGPELILTCTARLRVADPRSATIIIGLHVLAAKFENK